MKQILRTKLARKNIREMGIKTYRVADKRKRVKTFIDSALIKGQMVGIHWIKKGGEATRGCFTKKKMNLKGGVDTLANYPQYIKRVDTNRIDKGTGKRGRFTAILLDTVHTVKTGGATYNF